MKILAVNAGSSSFKFELVELPEKNVLASGLFEKVLEMLPKTQKKKALQTPKAQSYQGF